MKSKYVLAAGGFGNQLFIWNFAHHVNSVTNCKIRIVFPSSNILGDRKNQLDDLTLYCQHEIAVIKSSTFFALLRTRTRIVKHFKPAKKWIDSIFKVVICDSPEEIPSQDKLQSGKIFAGYYQDVKLVEECLPKYQKEFQELSLKIKSITVMESNLLTLKKRIGIHIRRGDYLNNRLTVGVLSLGYFRPLFEDQKILVACESNKDIDLDSNSIIKITGENFTEWQTFFLLSSCDELWISNSTFSWWAGKFGQTQKQIRVIAPNPWTKTDIYSKKYLKCSSFEYSQSIFE